MKKFFISRVRQKIFGNSDQEEVKSIVGTARDYFGSDFPNPKRIGCPPEESFRKLIGDKKLPDENLRSHLLNCSECFEEYRNLLQQAKLPAAASKPLFPLKPILLGGLVICLIVFGCLLWFRNADSENTKSAQNKHPASENSENEESSTNAIAESIETNSNITIENSAINNKSLAQKENKSINERQAAVRENAPLLAKNEVEINLNNPSVWRSANEPNQKPVVLQARRTWLRIKLPKENPQGMYEVFIVDELGKRLTEQNNIRARKGSLSVNLDLKGLSGNQKRLCLAPPGEIPDCVLIKIAP